MVVPFKETVSSPNPSYLSSLDKKMTSVVNSNIKPDEKIKLYNQLLENFMIGSQIDEPIVEVPKVQPVQKIVQKGPNLGVMNYKVLKDVQKALTRIGKITTKKSTRNKKALAETFFTENSPNESLSTLNESSSNFNASHLALQTFLDKLKESNNYSEYLPTLDDPATPKVSDFIPRTSNYIAQKVDFAPTPQLKEFVSKYAVKDDEEMPINNKDKIQKQLKQTKKKNSADKSLIQKTHQILQDRTRPKEWDEEKIISSKSTLK